MRLPDRNATVTLLSLHPPHYCCRGRFFKRAWRTEDLAKGYPPEASSPGIGQTHNR
jgi:hypothetical protein